MATDLAFLAFKYMQILRSIKQCSTFERFTLDVATIKGFTLDVATIKGFTLDVGMIKGITLDV